MLKSYCCLAGTRTFPGSYLSKNYGNRNTADNFFSLNTVDFEMKISHTVRLEITTTPQAENFFTTTPHKKILNTVTPQIPNVPLLSQCPSLPKSLNGYWQIICWSNLTEFCGVTCDGLASHPGRVAIRSNIPSYIHFPRGDSYMKRTRVLIVSLRGVNFGCWVLLRVLWAKN